MKRKLYEEEVAQTKKVQLKFLEHDWPDLIIFNVSQFLSFENKAHFRLTCKQFNNVVSPYAFEPLNRFKEFLELYPTTNVTTISTVEQQPRYFMLHMANEFFQAKHRQLHLENCIHKENSKRMRKIQQRAKRLIHDGIITIEMFDQVEQDNETWAKKAIIHFHQNESILSLICAGISTPCSTSENEVLLEASAKIYTESKDLITQLSLSPAFHTESSWSVYYNNNDSSIRMDAGVFNKIRDIFAPQIEYLRFVEVVFYICGFYPLLDISDHYKQVTNETKRDYDHFDDDFDSKTYSNYSVQMKHKRTFQDDGFEQFEQLRSNFYDFWKVPIRDESLYEMLSNVTSRIGHTCVMDEIFEFFDDKVVQQTEYIIRNVLQRVHRRRGSSVYVVNNFGPLFDFFASYYLKLDDDSNIKVYVQSSCTGVYTLEYNLSIWDNEGQKKLLTNNTAEGYDLKNLRDLMKKLEIPSNMPVFFAQLLFVIGAFVKHASGKYYNILTETTFNPDASVPVEEVLRDLGKLVSQEEKASFDILENGESEEEDSESEYEDTDDEISDRARYE
jgi:hypothetical protein